MTLQAVRTVSEDEDFHTIEGLLAFGGPFNGKDTYQTFFSARTDWTLSLHPAGLPVLFNHGFDADFGLEPIGRTAPPASFRMDDDGLWVQMQLDKRHKYYATRVRPLLDKDGVGLSQGSAEHSVRVDEKTGEVLAWPLQEVSITPTESNPWNVVAARSDEIIRIVDAIRVQNDPNVGGGVDRDKLPDEDFAGPKRSFPIVTPGDVSDAASSLGRAKGNKDSIKAKIISIAQRKGKEFEAALPDSWRSVEEQPAVRDLDEDHPTTDADGKAIVDLALRSSSLDAAQAAGIVQSLLFLRDCEMGEDDQVSDIDAAIGSLQSFMGKEMAEPVVADAGDMGLSDAVPGAYMTGLRAGARHSAADQAHVDAIHSHVAALGASAHSATPPASDADDDDAARTAEPLTTVRIVEREDAPVPRLDLDAIAARVAAETVTRLTG